MGSAATSFYAQRASGGLIYLNAGREFPIHDESHAKGSEMAQRLEHSPGEAAPATGTYEHAISSVR
jgi:hypothetical protein